MKWWDQMPWSSFFECFKPTFSLSSFTFIKTLFSSSSSATRRSFFYHLHFWSYWYFSWQSYSRLCFIEPDVSHDVLCIKLNKQGDNIQYWLMPFPVWNQSEVPCPVLTVVSWPTYRFLRRHVRWSYIPTCLRIFKFVVIHTVKGFGIVNKQK